MKAAIEWLKNNKKKSIIILSVIVLTIVGFIMVLLYNSSYAVDDDGDYLSVVCPDKIGPGDSVECDIAVNIYSIEATGFQADFEYSEGLTFDSFAKDASCTANNCFESVNGGQSAVVAWQMNNSPLSGMVKVGTLKLTTSDSLGVGDNITVSVKNAFIATMDDSVYLDDYTKTITINGESDINSLESITLSTGSLNETFDKDVLEYTATVDSDVLDISVTKTDDASTIDGDLSGIVLHYGTNDISIKVVSETNEERVYLLHINRPYKFENDYYVYNEESNYLYTYDDVNSNTIVSNINLPSSLTHSIQGNNYIVKYEDEELANIKVINFSFTDGGLADDKLYIGNNISYEQFMASLTLNGVTVKVFDSNGEEITSGNIASGNKMSVYYNGTLLDEYYVVLEYLDFGDLVVDSTNNIIKRVAANTTYEVLKQNIDTSGSVTITDYQNNPLTDNSIVKTGDVLSIELDGETMKYTISVLGDVTGDGKVLINDVAVTYRAVKNKATLSEAQKASANVVNDGNILINDVAVIYNFVKGKLRSLG